MMWMATNTFDLSDIEDDLAAIEAELAAEDEASKRAVDQQLDETDEQPEGETDDES